MVRAAPADNDMFGIITLEEYLDILINAKRVVGESLNKTHMCLHTP